MLPALPAWGLMARPLLTQGGTPASLPSFPKTSWRGVAPWVPVTFTAAIQELGDHRPELEGGGGVHSPPGQGVPCAPEGAVSPSRRSERPRGPGMTAEHLVGRVELGLRKGGVRPGGRRRGGVGSLGSARPAPDPTASSLPLGLHLPPDPPAAALTPALWVGPYLEVRFLYM